MTSVWKKNLKNIMSRENIGAEKISKVNHLTRNHNKVKIRKSNKKEAKNLDNNKIIAKKLKSMTKN